MTVAFHLLTVIVLFICPTFAQVNFGRNRIVQTSASCDERFMYFRINFERPFQGLIYTENAFPNCLYVNGSTSPTHSYDVKVPLTGCFTARSADGNYENSVIVQENVQYLEVSDKKFLLTCVPGSSSSKDSSFTVNFGGVTIDGAPPNSEIVRGSGPGELPALDYTVEIRHGRGPNGQSVFRPISVGEQISYVVRIADLKNNDARIGRCWAKDNTSEIQLSDDQGCSLQSSGSVWGNFQQESAGVGRIFHNEIKAWAFPTSARVNILCNMHVCAGTCPSYQCPATQQRSRREKPLGPDESESDLGIEVLNAGFNILPALRRTDTLTAEFQRSVSVVTGAPLITDKSPANDYVCLNRLHFAVGVALMLLVVILSLIFLSVATYRNFCSYRKSDPLDARAYRARVSALSEIQSVTS